MYALGAEQVRNRLRMINEDETYNSPENVIAVFSIPNLALKNYIYNILNPTDPSDPQSIIDKLDGKILGEDYTEPSITKTLISTPTSIDGYTPKNQKLRTYPYLYLGFNPPNGTNKAYRYEDFTNGTPSFRLMSEVNPNPSVYFIPQNYRGQTGDSLSDAVSLNGYPDVSYKTDVFNSWLAKNSSFIQINREREDLNYNMTKAGQGAQAIGAAANLAGNLASGNVGGGVAGAISDTINIALGAASNEKNHELNIREQLAQIEVQKLLPDNVSMSSSNATLLGYEKIHENIFTRYNIKAEFARKIDKYFDQFGYATNELKIPNINNRPNWNYVKCLATNINGSIPQMDLAEIKELFNSGITLWHNTANFKNYAVNNR